MSIDPTDLTREACFSTHVRGEGKNTRFTSSRYVSLADPFPSLLYSALQEEAHQCLKACVQRFVSFPTSSFMIIQMWLSECSTSGSGATTNDKFD